MFIWFEPWSLWLLIGVLCIGAELIIPGLVVIFFGFGAILTSVISLLPFIHDIFWLQILIFLLCSIVSLIFLRKKFTPVFKGSIFSSEKETSLSASSYAEVVEALSDKKEGRIKYNGTTWSAISTSEEIDVGEQVKVLDREGLRYIVEKV